jgi:hypothetical protein
MRLQKGTSFILSKLKELAGNPRSQFRIGDMVADKNGNGCPMKVVQIHKSNNVDDPFIYCQWFDMEQKTTKLDLFRESKLKLS